MRTQKEKSRERDRGRYKDREYARDMRIVRLAFRHSEKEWEEGAQKWSEDHKAGSLPLKVASGFRGAWLRNGIGGAWVGRKLFDERTRSSMTALNGGSTTLRSLLALCFHNSGVKSSTRAYIPIAMCACTYTMRPTFSSSFAGCRF